MLYKINDNKRNLEQTAHTEQDYRAHKSAFSSPFNGPTVCYVILTWKSVSELWGVTCHMESHSVTCHPTQVNVPRLNPSQPGRYSIHLPTPEGWKAELTQLAL